MAKLKEKADAQLEELKNDTVGVKKWKTRSKAADAGECGADQLRAEENTRKINANNEREAGPTHSTIRLTDDEVNVPPPDEPADNKVSQEWWSEFVAEEDQFKVELSGKISLLREVLTMCEAIGDKV